MRSFLEVLHLFSFLSLALLGARSTVIDRDWRSERRLAAMCGAIVLFLLPWAAGWVWPDFYQGALAVSASLLSSAAIGLAVKHFSDEARPES